MREMNLSLSKPSNGEPLGVLPTRMFRMNEVHGLAVGTTSKGNQNKYKTLDGRFYIKEQFFYQGRFWCDNLVEVVASQYAALCTLPSCIRYVKQGLCTIDGRTASYSEAFDQNGMVFIPYMRARKSLFGKEDVPSGTPEECFNEVVGDFATIAGADARTYIAHMMLLDLIVGNEDRHLNNFGFLVSDDGTLHLAPLFDFGLGMYEGDVSYDDSKKMLDLPDIRLKPFWFHISETKDFLLDECSDCWARTLPYSVNLNDFTFPSELAKMYFVKINKELGVSVIS